MLLFMHLASMQGNLRQRIREEIGAVEAQEAPAIPEKVPTALHRFYSKGTAAR